MKTHTGIAKVHEDYQSIYKGYTLKIKSLYIDYKNGMGEGVYADGSREYRLCLLGTPFIESHGYTNTVIHDSHLDVLELNETICLPFDEAETERLVEYIKQNPTKGLEDFIQANTKPSILPIPDLSTIYDDDEWGKREK